MEPEDDARERKLFVKDLSMALFTGASISDKYHNQMLARKNWKIVSTFSQQISTYNKEFFRIKLEEKLAPEYRDYIKEFEEDEKPYTDRYGRTSYFYVMLGQHVLPIYQPGTVMFDSGVEDGPNAVEHGGS